jgi:hypothetical protein
MLKFSCRAHFASPAFGPKSKATASRARAMPLPGCRPRVLRLKRACRRATCSVPDRPPRPGLRRGLDERISLCLKSSHLPRVPPSRAVTGDALASNILRRRSVARGVPKAGIPFAAIGARHDVTLVMRSGATKPLNCRFVRGGACRFPSPLWRSSACGWASGGCPASRRKGPTSFPCVVSISVASFTKPPTTA